MNNFDNKEKEAKIKILLQKKVRLYLLSGILFFISLILLAYTYFLVTEGSFLYPMMLYKVVFGFSNKSILSGPTLLISLSLVSFIVSIIFFVKALLIKTQVR